jgi:hypothetical protein
VDPNLDLKKIFTNPHHCQHRHKTLKMTKAEIDIKQKPDIKLSKYFQKLVRNAKKQYKLHAKIQYIKGSLK